MVEEVASLRSQVSGPGAVANSHFETISLGFRPLCAAVFRRGAAEIRYLPPHRLLR